MRSNEQEVLPSSHRIVTFTKKVGKKNYHFMFRLHALREQCGMSYMYAPCVAVRTLEDKWASWPSDKAQVDRIVESFAAEFRRTVASRGMKLQNYHYDGTRVGAFLLTLTRDQYAGRLKTIIDSIGFVKIGPAVRNPNSENILYTFMLDTSDLMDHEDEEEDEW